MHGITEVQSERRKSIIDSAKRKKLGNWVNVTETRIYEQSMGGGVECAVAQSKLAGGWPHK